MKKKWVLITAIILLFTFPLTACSSGGTDVNGNSDEVTTSIDAPSEGSEAITETVDVTKSGSDSGKVDTLTAYTDAWTELYSIHEKAVNNYTGMPILSLVMVALPLANSIFYSMLDLDNVDGNFSGKIGFGEMEGFYNKSGDTVKFGQDTIRKADGMMANDKLGDRVLTDGLFEAGKGYFRLDDSVMRDEKTISRTYTEFIQNEDGSFLCLNQVFSDLDYNSNESKTNKFTFISMSKDTYDFVTATGVAGVEGKLCVLTEGMTIEDATSQFLDLGYVINETGGIQNGVFVVD